MSPLLLVGVPVSISKELDAQLPEHLFFIETTVVGVMPSVHIQGAGLSAATAPVTYQVLVLLLVALLMRV